jgi:hypothetical protein
MSIVISASERASRSMSYDMPSPIISALSMKYFRMNGSGDITGQSITNTPKRNSRSQPKRVARGGVAVSNLPIVVVIDLGHPYGVKVIYR